MPILPFQIITLFADLIIFIFVGFYLLKLHAKEKELAQKEGKIDTDYHHIIDTALTKEKKILDDATEKANQILGQATHEANKIVADVKEISQTAQTSVDATLQQMVSAIKQETNTTAHNFITSYQTTLTQLANQSLTEFQTVTKQMIADNQKQTADYHTLLNTSLTEFNTIAKQLESDLQKQITSFHTTLLPALNKEIEEYKAVRLQQVDQTITTVIQKASQEIFNKSISLDDHQKLLIQSLEKAKKEGVFS